MLSEILIVNCTRHIFNYNTLFILTSRIIVQFLFIHYGHIDRIVVGYERTMYNTTEGQRSVVLVAVISFPAPRPFTIAASTSSGTAGQNMCTPYLV